MQWTKKLICIISVGIIGVFFAAPTAYACCGISVTITDDPVETACVGQEVVISGVITGVEVWPSAYSTGPATLTVEVSSPSGEVTILEAVLSNLQEFRGASPPYATWDFAVTYVPTEAGTYTYVKITTWISASGWTAFSSASGIFDVVQCEGKVTGGGWFLRPGGTKPQDRNTFGFVAQYQQDSVTPTGNLEFQVHGGAINVKSTTITGLYVTGNTATFRGLCSVNGAPGFEFTVTVVDNGEPGKGVDTFAITVPGVLAIPPTTLNGGNIQVHK